MAKVIHVGLSNAGVTKAIKELNKYKQWVQAKETELRTRLAARGADVASIQFSGAVYDGNKDISVRVDHTGSVAVIYAEGRSVAFVEFGSGAKYGYGHPQAAELGVGPGTYPSEKHLWDNPKGWWYGTGQHSYGNPPAMAMYQAVQRMTEELTMIAKEVFSS